MTLWIVLAIAILSPLAVMAIFVDDWRRDLTTNRAWTSADAEDRRLRPLEVEANVDAVADCLAQLVVESPSWFTYGEDALPPEDSPLHVIAAANPASTWRLVHKSRLMRYQDDVWVVTETIASGCSVHFHSQSRVGKGDLGQNPRNIRELREWIESNL